MYYCWNSLRKIRRCLYHEVCVKWYPTLHFYSALKDGYESDSTLVFKRRENYTPTPQTPIEAKAVYNQVTKSVYKATILMKTL